MTSQSNFGLVLAGSLVSFLLIATVRASAPIPAVQSDLKVSADEKPAESATGVSYSFVSRDEWVRISPDLDSFQLYIVEKLNRVDRSNLDRLDRLIIPEGWLGSELAYSPLPFIYPWARIYEKALVVSLSHQVFGGYEEGCLVYWGPISSGRLEHPTPSGLFHLNWKAKGRRSTLNRNWYLSWYFNFHNERGLSFHQYQLPGYPASHACLRLLERDARWLYHWGESWQLEEDGVTIARTGTPVIIIGQFNWKEPSPWLSEEVEDRNVTLPWLPGID